jgi:hypothetical protein
LKKQCMSKNWVRKQPGSHLFLCQNHIRSHLGILEDKTVPTRAQFKIYNKQTRWCRPNFPHRWAFFTHHKAQGGEPYHKLRHPKITGI